MDYYIIPLTTDPNQTFDITIPIDGNNVPLTLNLSYNSKYAYWWLTIIKNDLTLIDAMPILYSGYPAADLLEQYKYLKLGSAFLIKSSDIQDDTPNDTNLDTAFVLMWGDTIV